MSPFTVHQVVAHDSGKILVLGSDCLPIGSPCIAKAVIVVVQTSKCVADSVVEVRGRPVD